MATLTLDPTNVKVFYGAPSGVSERQFGIDISTGNLYYTADGTGTWTLLSTGGGNLINGTTAITSGTDGRLLIQLSSKLGESADLTWDATTGLAVGKDVTITGKVVASSDISTSGLLKIVSGGSVTISTGVGSVKMTSSNAATNTAWIPINYAGTTYYVPAWTTNNP